MDDAPRKKKWTKRRLVRVLVWAVFLPLTAVAGLNLWVLRSAQGRIFTPTSPVPGHAVAVVLGTSKKRENGQPNLHYERRMDAAAELFRRRTVRHILVSGAVDGAYYNEPRDMTESLLARGVPESAISRDTAGFRTLDSVVRAHESFGLERCLIVSDGWHVPRALYIARHAGLEAEGIAAAEIPLAQSFKARTREWFARVLVVLDVHLLHTRPQTLEAPATDRTLGARFP